MAGTGMDWSAAIALKRRDVDIAGKGAQVRADHYHHWRDAYAVGLRKRGMPDRLIARPLGHLPRSLLVALRYGGYTPATDEIARAAAANQQAVRSTRRST
jgi:hypothetical protein